MRRAISMLLLASLAAPLAACGSAGVIPPAAEQQALVDRSTLTVQEMLSENDPNGARDARDALRRARAAVICPRVFRAGFLVGGQGGTCVLVARDGAGSWSSPSFYSMGSGSLGLQIGLQDMQVMMLILTDKGLRAVLDNQFKFGGDISIAIATVGGGIAGATTTAVGADIVAYARTRGLYAGLTLEGTVLSPYREADQAYYGRPVSSRQIVIDMAAHNPAADPLRAVLMQYSAPAAAQGYAPPGGPGMMPQQPYSPATSGYGSSGAVQREQLR
ncbi:lipid-binding SYLF domain-containing protein [Roseomonas elaeocarpi]|uniref:Lipid-binding SYLF domain-containing protein n=1 Tax=Roseomonas elaeocarpi TaxID=907779 RepID=A0ABV6JST6_9PROT